MALKLMVNWPQLVNTHLKLQLCDIFIGLKCWKCIYFELEIIRNLIEQVNRLGIETYSSNCSKWPELQFQIVWWMSVNNLSLTSVSRVEPTLLMAYSMLTYVTNSAYYLKMMNSVKIDAIEKTNVKCGGKKIKRENSNKNCFYLFIARHFQIRQWIHQFIE